MCKLIAELIGTDKRILAEMLRRLEHASGAPGVDLRLTSEIYGRLHMKMRALGLDPNDTTPHELYQALLNLTALHDRFLADKIGVSDRANPEIVFPAIVTAVSQLSISKKAWAIKELAAKRLLKAMPPKTLMKLLNYRSVDSMLKRERIPFLLAIARHIEPEAWQKKFTLSYKNLHASDFEEREIEVVYLNQKRWHDVGESIGHHKSTTILHIPEMAVVVLLPIAITAVQGLTLMSLLLVTHYLNEIRTFSTQLKFHNMRPDFGKYLAKTLEAPDQAHANLAGQPIHWRIIHRHYGSSQQTNHPEIFEPHIQPEDLAYKKAEAILFRFEPALHFWHDLDYVGLPQITGGPVSFNLMDMAMNLIGHKPYEKRVNYHLRGALWNEIYGRYIAQPSLERDLMRQLDDQLIAAPDPARDMEFAW